MKLNNEKSSLLFPGARGLLQVKMPAKKPIINDQGFGFYYPNAVAVISKNFELVRIEADRIVK